MNNKQKKCIECHGERIVSSHTPGIKDGHVCFHCGGSGIDPPPVPQTSSTGKKTMLDDEIVKAVLKERERAKKEMKNKFELAVRELQLAGTQQRTITHIRVSLFGSFDLKRESLYCSSFFNDENMLVNCTCGKCEDSNH